jgi:hypothetical protein
MFDILSLQSCLQTIRFFALLHLLLLLPTLTPTLSLGGQGEIDGLGVDPHDKVVATNKKTTNPSPPQ